MTFSVKPFEIHHQGYCLGFGSSTVTLISVNQGKEILSSPLIEQFPPTGTTEVSRFAVLLVG